MKTHKKTTNNKTNTSQPFFNPKGGENSFFNKKADFFPQTIDTKSTQTVDLVPINLSQKSPVIQREAAEDEEPGNAVEDVTTYYVSEPKATIRENDTPTQFTTNEIPSGVKAKRLRELALNGNKFAWKIEILDTEGNTGVAVGNTFWTTSTNVTKSESVAVDTLYQGFYSDNLTVYQSPYGKNEIEGIGEESTNVELPLNSSDGLKKIERCGIYVKLKKGSEEVGWVAEYGLIPKSERDNMKKLEAYRDWLGIRYQETIALNGQDKIDRANGVLSQIEEVCHQIEAGNYPDLVNLSQSPSYQNHSYRSFVPPILTAQVRKFIQVIESYEPETPLETEQEGESTTVEDTTEESEETLTDTINWNTRLRAPQYRTQSDNLTPPEATCAPTAFSIAVERIGYSREDVRNAIDENLTGHRKKEYRKKMWSNTEYRKQQYLASEEGQAATETANGEIIVVPETYMPDLQAPADFEPNAVMPNDFLTTVAVPKDFEPTDAYPVADLETKWKEKAKTFFQSFTGSSNWQKLRNGASGGLVGNEAAVADKFREYGQYEDFTYFLAYLNGINRGSIPGANNSQKLINLLENPNGTDSTSNVERIDIAAANQPFLPEYREKMRKTLEDGGAVVLSLLHKGIGYGLDYSHVVTVRNVTSKGLELDDPYGQINPSYRRKSGLSDDAYKDTGGTGYRSSYDWQNKRKFDASETDYEKRDFTESASENLDADESRGMSSMISWEMINESTDLVKYIMLIKQ